MQSTGDASILEDMLNRRARKNTTPVIILAGFLGAGKTTVLNHLLRTTTAKIAVIVNDFGSINIDSLLITSRVEEKIELSNGCLCCSLGDGEFEETLETILTGVNRPDAIVIEASGLAEPEDMAKMVVLSQNESVAYGGTVYVVDAVNVDGTRKKHPEVKEHLSMADLVALTKTEQLNDEKINKVEAEIGELTSAPIVSAPHGQIAPELLFDIPPQTNAQLSLLQQPEHHHHQHLHDVYTTVTFEASEPLAPEKFKHYMDNLPDGVYRAKGIVDFGLNGYGKKFAVQAVGKRWDMYAEDWRSNEAPRTSFVLIGTDFDTTAALDDLQTTVGDSMEMLDMRRYAA